MAPVSSVSRVETPDTETQTRKGGGNKVMTLVLGADLATSTRLPSYLLFTLSDFLAFVAIYIPYTHLPPLAKVGV